MLKLYEMYEEIMNVNDDIYVENDEWIKTRAEKFIRY